MKINEIFDQDYYDRVQRQIHNVKPHQPTANDSETSIQDFIITAYETGEIGYDEALYQLKQKTKKDQMFFWEHELAMAKELQELKKSIN